ncbi:COG3014 family protein [Vibrio sp. MA40-2]|uniref:COG3014 family protein n=1 Tax=Vibrio sp. MA40-2 TaxID=3391828 RepID=UPI0039A54212
MARVVGLSVVVTACSSLSMGNLFSHYSIQNQAVYSAVVSGQYQQAADSLPDSIAGDILDNMEKGRVNLLAQDYVQSKAFLESSEYAVRVQQEQAVVSLSESASSVGSLTANDNVTSYYPADYEVGFLHLYLALNYLQENALEGALVEIRKANLVQEQAKKTREADLAAAQQQLTKDGLSPNLGSILSQYPDAGEQLQAVQNSYLLFLSGLLYETAGELNNAYVDYKRALAVMPNNREIITGTARVAKKLGMSDDLLQLIDQYGQLVSTQSNIVKQGRGQIIVIDEHGVVAAKQGWKQSLPIYTSGNWSYFSMSVPYYPKQVTKQFATLKINQKTVRQSKLVDVNLMAQQDLTERMPTILLRQALRVVAKEQVRKEVAKNDEVGNLLVNVWNVLTEQPDTRSWQTLPAQVYSSSEIVEAGEYELEFGLNSYKVNVDEGKTVLVWISRQGTNATFWHKQLGSL